MARDAAFDGDVTLVAERVPPVSRMSANSFDAAAAFDLVPIPLWTQDFSNAKLVLEGWRAAGVSDLRAYVFEDPERLVHCLSKAPILRANRLVLRLFGVVDVAAFSKVWFNRIKDLPAEVGGTFFPLLQWLWSGQREYAYKATYSRPSGRTDEMLVQGSLLPGYEKSCGQALIAIENRTAEEQAKRRLSESERYARGLFDQSPVALWVEDYSEVKRLISDIRQEGVHDVRAYAKAQPHFAARCLRAFRVVDINQQSLALFGATDLETLMSRMEEVMRDDGIDGFIEMIANLWEGKLYYQNEIVIYRLDSGERLDLVMQVSVLPGHEEDWKLVLIALTDITERKRTESYLQFLGRHDVLTKLHNRTYYMDEIERLERRGAFPVIVIIADLDGLKAANDGSGHAAGDDLLRRAGNVLVKAVAGRGCAARIGGDEFALLVPAAGEAEATRLLALIEALTEEDNRIHPGTVLRLSIGAAICQAAGGLETAIREADMRMYEDKRAYYRSVTEMNRRRGITV